MPAPANERNPTSILFKLGMRLRFAWACLTAEHLVVAWSNRKKPGDNVGFVGLDMRLVHQTDKAAEFLTGRLQFEANIQAMCGETDTFE